MPEGAAARSFVVTERRGRPPPRRFPDGPLPGFLPQPHPGGPRRRRDHRRRARASEEPPGPRRRRDRLPAPGERTAAGRAPGHPAGDRARGRGRGDHQQAGGSGGPSGTGHPDGTLVNGLMHRYGLANVGGTPCAPASSTGWTGTPRDCWWPPSTNRPCAHSRTSCRPDAWDGPIWPYLGPLDRGRGELRGDIGRHPRRRQRMAVVERGGRGPSRATRSWRTTTSSRSAGWGWKRAGPPDPRPFRPRGHPVVGDPVYGDDKRASGVHNLDRRRADAMVKGARRQMLHAAELRFVHPADGRELVFTSEPPADMAGVLAGLRARELRPAARPTAGQSRGLVPYPVAIVLAAPAPAARAATEEKSRFDGEDQGTQTGRRGHPGDERATHGRARRGGLRRDPQDPDPRGLPQRHRQHGKGRGSTARGWESSSPATRPSRRAAAN